MINYCFNFEEPLNINAMRLVPNRESIEPPGDEECPPGPADVPHGAWPGRHGWRGRFLERGPPFVVTGLNKGQKNALCLSDETQFQRAILSVIPRYPLKSPFESKTGMPLTLRWFVTASSPVTAN